MKAAVVGEPGGVPRYAEFAEPEVAPGFEVVDLVATAIHPVVRAKASGSHYSSTGNYPLVPGVDAVARRADGTLVYTAGVQEPWGTFAERMSAPGLAMAPLPAGAGPVAVAAGMNPGMSSWMPLTAYVTAHGSVGTVLILGATGMAGGLAVQNAHALGATRVLAVGRGADALERVAGLGAETVALTGDIKTDATAIAAALDGNAPALVLDFLWGGVAEATFQALMSISDGKSTQYVEIGSSAGEQAVVPAALLRGHQFQLCGSGIGSFDMLRYFTESRAYVDRIGTGEVTVSATAYSLSQVSEAWQAGAGPRPVLTLP